MIYEKNKYNDTRPNAGVTIVPFIYDNGVIKVLVYKRDKNSEVFQSYYSLPNRFFNITEFSNLDDAANYALEEKTNVSIPNINQFYTFSGSYIDPTRILTLNVCYYSILRKSEVISVNNDDPFEKEWMPVNDALNLTLAFNHNEVLKLAYEKLLNSAEYTITPLFLLDEDFTITEMRNLTEILLGEKLDNSRFRDRIKKSGVLIESENKIGKVSNRPAQLYKINPSYKGCFYPKSVTKSK